MRVALKGSTAATAVEIWFQDEARVGQKGGHAYVWAARGTRPLMVRDNHHDSAYIFGAICPARGVGAAIITPGANTEMMNLHLAEISTQVALGAVCGLRAAVRRCRLGISQASALSPPTTSCCYRCRPTVPS